MKLCDHFQLLPKSAHDTSKIQQIWEFESDLPSYVDYVLTNDRLARSTCAPALLYDSIVEKLIEKNAKIAKQGPRFTSTALMN